MQRECRSEIYVILIILLVTKAHSLENDTKFKDNGLVFNNVYYNKEMLFNQFGETHNLMMHPSGNLFFSHIMDIKNKTYGITVCNLKTMTCKPVKGIREGYAIAYDQGNDKVYLGGKGIYVYNFRKQYAIYFAEKYKTIFDISVGRNFYFVEYPTKKLYLYKRGRFVKTNKTERMEVEKFFVSNTVKIYFTNRSGLFKVEKPYKNPRTYILSNKLVINQIAQDIQSRRYFCATDGIYVEDRSNRLKKIANIDHARGLTFQTMPKLAVIYSDRDAIYRLVTSANASQYFNRKNMDNSIKKENISKRDLQQLTNPLRTELQQVTNPLRTELQQMTNDLPIDLQMTNPSQNQRRFINPEFVFRGKIMHF